MGEEVESSRALKEPERVVQEDRVDSCGESRGNLKFPEDSCDISLENRNLPEDPCDVSQEIHDLPAAASHGVPQPNLPEPLDLAATNVSSSSPTSYSSSSNMKKRSPNVFQKFHAKLQSRSFKIKDFVSDKADRFKHFVTSRC